MTRYRHPRVDLYRGRPRARRPAARKAAPPVERCLNALGANPSLTDALLGDLAEERARRAEADGTIAARWWYLREAFRAAPHLLLNALRHGGARGRARAAAVLLALAIVPSVAWIAFALRDAPPARLVVDGRGTNGGVGGIVINSQRPVQLTMHALDANGNTLHSAAVRFQWVTGVPLRITQHGVVTCTQAGDATVRASEGTVSTTVLLRCRPVQAVNVEGYVGLLAGGAGHDLALEAFGPDGKRVDLLAGEVRIEDSTIATLMGTHIRPLRPGQTGITVRIGDGETGTMVNVYEVARNFNGLRPDQRLVVAPVRLARGETIRWQLPKGWFYLSFDPAPGAPATPTLAVYGSIMCIPEFGPTVHNSVCLARAHDASVRITNPSTSPSDVVGNLAFERHPADAVPIPAPRTKRDP